MKKKLAIIVAILVALSMSIAACSGGTVESGDESAAESETESVAESETESAAESDSDNSGDQAGGYTMGIVTKSAGNAFYDASLTGAEKAASELGDTVIQQGPDEATAEKQIEIINNFTSQNVNCLIVTANDAEALAPSLAKAQDQGIKVVAFDSDVAPESRSVFVNPADTEAVGLAQAKAALELTGGEGDIAILSATATATNQNAWIAVMEEEFKKPEYSNLNLVTTVYGDDKPDKSYQEMNGLIQSYPDLKVVIIPTGVGLNAAAKAITDANLIGKIQITGLGLPSEAAEYIESGAAPKVFFWNPIDLGYVTQYASHAICDGSITGAIGDKIDCGELGEKEVVADANGNSQVVLGELTEFNKDNIAEWKTVF
jgi:rhamnose transport system substrate-binding protein